MQLITPLQILSSALTLRRQWDGMATAGLIGGACDRFLLVLIIMLEPARMVYSDDQELATVLRGLFPTRSIALTASMSQEMSGQALVLQSFESLLDWKLPDCPILLYGLPEAFAAPHAERDLRISPLAFLGAATWTSRLAWLSMPPHYQQIETSRRRLRSIVSAEEFDLLDLLESSLQMRERETIISPPQTYEEGDRLQLLRRIRELERSILLQHQLTLASKIAEKKTQR